MDENIVDIEEAVLEETNQVTGLVPATQEAIDLPDCQIHDFVFLRSAKIRAKIKDDSGKNVTSFTRVDTFYCQHCLRYTQMERSERTEITPAWFRDDR